MQRTQFNGQRDYSFSSLEIKGQSVVAHLFQIRIRTMWVSTVFKVKERGLANPCDKAPLFLRTQHQARSAP